MKDNKENKKSYLTQGDKKLLISFRRFLKREPVLLKIQDLRKKYDIPKNGLKKNEVFKPNEDGYQIYVGDFDFPIRIDFNSALRKDIKEYLLEEFPVKSNFIIHLTKMFILYNNIDDYIDFDKSKEEVDLELFNIFDLVDDMEIGYDVMNDRDAGTGQIHGFIEEIMNRGMEYPISIGIPNGATKRDLLEYIKKNWNKIEKLRNSKKENKKWLAVRKSNPEIERRDDFIYKHRKKSLKEIKDLVIEKFEGSLDGDRRILYTWQIKNIIDREKKKRS